MLTRLSTPSSVFVQDIPFHMLTRPSVCICAGDSVPHASSGVGERGASPLEVGEGRHGDGGAWQVLAL